MKNRLSVSLLALNDFSKLDDFLDLMKKAGCHTIIIGIDSADLESLAIYKRKVSEKTLSSLIDHANKIKLNVCADFIIGLPH